MYEARQCKEKVSRRIDGSKIWQGKSLMNILPVTKNIKMTYPYTVQMINDLTYDMALLLNIIRLKCEDLLWPTDKNHEVQVAIDNNSKLYIGYNTNSTQPKSIKRDSFMTKLLESVNTELQSQNSIKLPSFLDKHNERKITLSDIIIAKKTDSDQNVHAEMMILKNCFYNLLNDIAESKELHQQDLYLRGKKLPCGKCKKILDFIIGNMFISTYIRIHIPDQSVFSATSTEKQNQSRTTPVHWENPFDFLKENELKTNYKLKFSKMEEERPYLLRELMKIPNL